jgi:ATP-dependent RNA helicase RhlB
MSPFGGVDLISKRNIDANFVDIMVATPGRLIDFIEQKEVWLIKLNFW